MMRSRNPKPKAPKRIVPGTRFVIAELEPINFRNSRSSAKFKDAVQAGHFVPVPPRLAPKGKSNAGKRFFLYPVSLATEKGKTDLHQRSHSAVVGPKGQRHTISARGTGSYSGYRTDGMKGKDSPDVYPFARISEKSKPTAHDKSVQHRRLLDELYDRKRPSSFLPEHEFFGGETLEPALYNIEAGAKLESEFLKAARSKDKTGRSRDPVLREALSRGIRHALVPVPIGVFKPRQTLVQFQKRKEQTSEELDAFKKGMRKKERKAFDFAYAKAKPGEVITVKLVSGLRRVGIPLRLRRQQAIYTYSTESNLRIAELRPLYAEHRRERIPLDVAARGKTAKARTAQEALEKWQQVFASYDFDLIPGRGRVFFRGGEKQADYDVHKKGRRVRLRDAQNEIIEEFSFRMALNLHVAQTRSSGSFLFYREGRLISNGLKSSDVTVRGETPDLDALNFEPNRLEHKMNVSDRDAARMTISEFAFKLAGSSRAKDKQVEALTARGLDFFEHWLSTGKKFIEEKTTKPKPK